MFEIFVGYQQKPMKVVCLKKVQVLFAYVMLVFPEDFQSSIQPVASPAWIVGDQAVLADPHDLNSISSLAESVFKGEKK